VRALPDLEAIHKELKKKGVTLKLVDIFLFTGMLLLPKVHIYDNMLG